MGPLRIGCLCLKRKEVVVGLFGLSLFLFENAFAKVQNLDPCIGPIRL